MNTDYINSLIGSPWVYIENDCFAVVRKALKGAFGIDVPYIPLPDVSSADDNARLFDEHSRRDEWAEVIEPLPGDVVLFYRKGIPNHIGLYIGNWDCLHCFGCPKNPGVTVVENLRKMNKILYPAHKFFRYENNSGS